MSCNKDNVKFTVFFNSNEGTAVPPQIVIDGKKATKPEDPTRSGYTFMAWQKDAGLTNEWKFDIDVVTEDVTLYAKWEPKQMIITTSASEIWFSMEGTGTTIVDWGDGSPQRIVSIEDDDITWIECRHRYSVETTHTITIIGDNIWSMQCPGGLITLDVSKNLALKELHCFNNPLTFLNVSGLTLLEILSCSNNLLTSLDISGLTQLKSFVCWGNPLSSLNMSGLSNLEWADCSKNQLTSLNIAGFTSTLTYFDCGRNYMNSTTLNNLFASLPIVVSGSIQIYNNGPDYDGSGTDGCDVTIAEKKGWYVYTGD